MKDIEKDDYPKTQGVEGIVRYKKMSPEDLASKLELAKKGDELAFKDILSCMHYFLVRLKDRFFIQGSDSEDIYQEGAIKLMNVIEKFDPNKGNFVTFAQQAIEKHIITCINREKAQKRIHLNNALSLNVGMGGNDNDEDKTTFLDNLCDDKPSESFNPIEIVQKDYEIYLIEEISKVLSTMEAKVFYLRFIEHYSYRDIAIELGFFKKVSGKAYPDQKSVDNAIMRSRPKIKKVLERLGLSPKDVLNPMKELDKDLNKKEFGKEKIIAKKDLKEKNKKIKINKEEKVAQPPKKRRGRPPKVRIEEKVDKKKVKNSKEKSKDKKLSQLIGNTKNIIKKRRGRPPKAKN